ncbi:uncharacterized protein LOC119093530 [Pollicipes pollicipes]|uniref:uncharacterized protein LOC119093530 n=1 Tax=Pollicipes pollicipes TaxID=41117 RepID=UPI0018855CFA|nr:uncharacterized protein LOC119093530 [Pollicipes pollicipes]
MIIGEEPDESTRLRRLVQDGSEEVGRLTQQLDETSRTVHVLRAELRVALEAMQDQRREADLRLISSSDSRLHELGSIERCKKELQALAARWQTRAEASERGRRQREVELQQERTRRVELEDSLLEASACMREIQQRLERHDQYSTWAKLNQSLQLKQVESVMLALLKVTSQSAREVAPPTGAVWSGSCGGSLDSCSSAELGSEASLATTEPERRRQDSPDAECSDTSTGISADEGQHQR